MIHKDLSGQRFGKLTILNLDHKQERPDRKGCFRYFYLCLCDCGQKTIVDCSQLKNGHVVSCGCFRKELGKIKCTSHGLRYTKLYKIWTGLKNRCSNKNNKRYGGRGIGVCPDWKKSFMSFYQWAINNDYKDGLTIDRINVDGDYCPENCRWATIKEQQNNRSTNHMITYKNKTQSISNWCQELNLDYKLVIDRLLKKHWSFEKAISMPKRNWTKH